MNLGTLGSLAIDVGANLARFQSDMGRASRIADQRSKEIAAKIGKATAAISAVGVASAGVAAVAVKRAIDRADELDELSQKVGASTAALSRLQFGAQLEGVDDFTGSLTKLSKTMVEAKDRNSAAGKAFDALGVKATDQNGKLRSTDAVLRDVAEAFSGSEDGATKAAIAQELFGKSGAALIPFLNNGAAGLDRYGDLAERLGLVVDTKTAAAAGKFNDQLFIGGKAIVGLSTRVASGLLPTMTDLATQFVTYSTNGENVKTITSGINTGIKGLIVSGIALKSVIGAVGTLAGTTFGTIARVFENADLNASDGLIPIKGLIKIGLAVKGESGAIKDSFGDMSDAMSMDMERIAGVLNAGSKSIEDSTGVIAAASEEAKRQLNFGGGGGAGKPTDLEKAVEKAGERLREMDADLRKQIATFGMGEQALISYRLTTGDLSDEVNLLGDAGQILADRIRVQASELEGYNAIQERDLELKRQAAQLAEAVIQRGQAPDTQARADAIRRAGEQGGLGSFGRVQNGIANAQDEERRRAADERAALQEGFDQGLLDRQTYQAAVEASERDHQSRMKDIEAAGQEAKRSLYANAFEAVGNLGDQFQASVLAQSKKGFEISKAISIVQATIKSYDAAVSAYAALAGIPIVGPALGAGAAAAAVTFGLAQVAAIKSTNFEGRRYGGPVRKGGMYEVTEGGEPELLKMGGRTMLMMGNASGYVSPASAAAAGGGSPVQIIINNHEPVSVGATSRQGPDGLQVIEMTIRKDLASSGPISNDLARTFGLSRRPSGKAGA